MINMENLIQKIKIFLLIIMSLVYLGFSFKFAHEKWITGITIEEQEIEDRLIWQW